MKIGFYPKLAFEGIRKNKRLYLPYMLTCIGMVMMYYIVTFLGQCDALSSIPGSASLRSTMDFGSWIIAIFSVIFLFYTNSLLIRRRKKEFGLYNILGMNKKNLTRILVWEAVMIALVSFVFGLIFGIVLSKLAELGLVNIMNSDITYTLSVSFEAILMTLIVFGALFVLLLLNSIRQIKTSNAIKLLRGENIGEKPPKANWFFGIVGAIILAGGYYISVSIEHPISALEWFFVAVIMVIIGTYLVFISGSVLFCHILQKKTNYYYKPNHFISVSSMVYRMKRNGAGLASICILATMVLVMISSTTSLYFGAEDSLRSYYPRDICATVNLQTSQDMSNENIASIRDTILQTINRYETDTENVIDYRSAYVTGLAENGVIETDVTRIDQFGADKSNLYQIHILPLEDYNRLMNQTQTLEKNQALIFTCRADYNEDTVAIRGGNTFEIKEHLTDLNISDSQTINALPSMYIIVSDMQTGLAGITDLKDYNGDPMVSLGWMYEFDTPLESAKQIDLCEDIDRSLNELTTSGQYGIDYTRCWSLEANRADFYNTYGGLFFLGIILSIVFIFAAVLIIYYKQISEGYEDQSRFEIMQKVGLSKKSIRKSINSQLLTVFFLPLIGAGMHLAFAFPIIHKLLLLFNLNNTALFALTTMISFLAFALLYTIIYRFTSNAYYHIVSDNSNS